MIICSTIIKTILCFALIFCSGCGQSFFSFGKKAVVPPSPAPHETPTLPSAPLTTSAEPLPVAKKPVRYDTDADFTRTYHNDVLTEDVILDGRVLISGVLTIARQATLRVAPGTVVFFAPDRKGEQEGTLFVQGRIEALGTAASVIIFKAATSDKSRDSWRGIVVLGSEKNNQFEHCRIEGATVGLDSIFSTVSMKNTTIQSCRTGARLHGSLFQALGGGVGDCDLGYALLDSESYLRNVSCTDNLRGLSLLHGSLSVKGSTFSGNTARALEAVDSAIDISGAVFSKNGTGLTLSGSEGVIDSCKIVENREYGLQLLHAKMKITANQIFMNTGIGIMADSGNSAAWGNIISRNGLYDFYYAGDEEFRAIGNWWGASMGPGSKKRFFDKNNSVLTFPELTVSPPALR